FGDGESAQTLAKTYCKSTLTDPCCAYLPSDTPSLIAGVVGGLLFGLIAIGFSVHMFMRQRRENNMKKRMERFTASTGDNGSGGGGGGFLTGDVGQAKNIHLQRAEEAARNSGLWSGGAVPGIVGNDNPYRNSNTPSAATRHSFPTPTAIPPAPPGNLTPQPASLYSPSPVPSQQSHFIPSHPRYHARSNSVASKFSVRSVSYATRQRDFSAEMGEGGAMPSVYRAVVTEGYEAMEEDEVDLNAGDSVGVFRVFEDGWGWGVNQTTGKKGVFPVVCLGEM
ncbi:hypothetical protein HDV00_002178, partial [Rhizophlyctis rosea]